MSDAARRTTRLMRRYVKPRMQTLFAAMKLVMPLLHRLGRRAPFAPQTPADWTPAQNGGGVTLFYLHGGGFLVGSPRQFRYVARQFAAAGFDVFMPSYRLAPEHVFPAALEDALAAWRALAAAGRGPIVLAGMSAGGGLAVSLMLRLRAEGLPMPVATALFSPWTDLAATGPSTRTNEACDAMFTRKTLLIGARAVLGTASARDPLASPIYGDLVGLPPMLVHAGADEALRDDATRLVDRARAAGVDAQLELWPDVPHSWQLMPFIPEATESTLKAVAFFKDRLNAIPPQ
jgi:monoterpene epsilon-lactone hydrolase